MGAGYTHCVKHGKERPPALRAMLPHSSPRLGGQGGRQNKKVEAAEKRSKKTTRSLPVFPIMCLPSHL